MDQGSDRSSKIQPEPESNDRIQPEPEDNERRPALFNNFNFFKRKPENPAVSRVPVAKELETKSNSFWVPPPNKNLKSITNEELKNDDNIIAVLSSISCACALAGNEQTFLRYSEEESYVLYFRCALLIISIASVIWIVRRYQMLLVHQVLTYTVGVKDTLWTSGLWKTMTIEIMIHSFFSPPGIDYYFTVSTLGYEIEYSLDDIFTVLALFRLYTLLRLFGHHSIYTQKTAETVCERNGESADSIFALKSFIQDSPFLGIGIVFISLSLFSAVVMMIFERPPTISDGQEKPSTLSNLADNLWVIFFTTTTVGYGNIYPITHMGRLTCILACIFGNMYLGMLVVAINQKMDHSDSENLSYAWIYRHYVKNDSRRHAIKSIRLAATLYLLSKRWKCNCISPIKPNPPVSIGKVAVLFDRRFLNEQQFIKKCQVYRALKRHLLKMSDIIDDARNIGRKEIENIKLIEDTVRVDTSIIFNKIQKMITRDTLLVNSQTSHSQTNIEKKLLEVKDLANKMRKTMRTVLRRQSTQDDSPLLRRVSLGSGFLLS